MYICKVFEIIIITWLKNMTDVIKLMIGQIRETKRLDEEKRAM